MQRDFHFPLTPYSIQLAYMNKLYMCLSAAKGGLFESPTGTGKTLSIICASLTFFGDHLNSLTNPIDSEGSPSKRMKIEPIGRDPSNTQAKPKIVYLTRTHLQLDQFTAELKKTRWGKNNLVKLARLASRKFLCINEDIKGDKKLIDYKCKLLTDPLRKSKNNQLLDDEDPNKIKKKTCKLYLEKESMSQVIQGNICDIEDLVEFGKELKACPYFASRIAMMRSDIILATYYSVLNHRSRQSLSLDLTNCYVIIDESHNIVDSITDCYSGKITYKQINSCIECIETYRRFKIERDSNNPHLEVAEKSIKILNDLKNFIDRHKQRDYHYETKESVFLHYNLQEINFYELWNYYETNDLTILMSNLKVKRKTESNKDLNALIAFHEFLLNLEEDDAVFLIKKDVELKSMVLKFMILDPYKKFKESLKDATCVVLTGGTLSPIEEFNHLFSYLDHSQLIHFSCKHVAPSENLLLTTISKSLSGDPLVFSLKNREIPSTLSSLTEILCNLCQVVPHGIVVFFQCYSYLKIFKESLSEENTQKISNRKEIFFDSRDEKILKDYSEVAERRGAILFAVIRGSLSEGINFSDKLGRCVVVVGMPYLNPYDPEVIIKKKNYDKTNWYSGHRFYQNSCDVAVNQCIGRAIRHQKDFAAVVLIDSRFNTRASRRPEWMIQSAVDIKNTEDILCRVKKFFRDRINK